MPRELVANVLGVRREGMVEAGGNLQCAGLFTYSCGHTRVLDRSGFEREACECYNVVKKEFDRPLRALPCSSTRQISG